MGKLYAVEAAANVTRRCVQLVGYDGYSRDYPFERLMRDAKITEIYGGNKRSTENGYFFVDGNKIIGRYPSAL